MEINLKTVLLVTIGVFCLLWPSAGRATTADAPAMPPLGPSEFALKLDQLAKSEYWKRLLHFKHSFPSGERSEVDSDEFFLSPQGRSDAFAELKASVAAFAEPISAKIGIYQTHPQCVYPERFRYLKSQLGFTSPDVDCESFKEWKSALAVKSIKLVYAAPYLGNPASMFGHTFLRLSSTGSDLLDTGVSFDALPTNDRGLSYAWNGLTGSYDGIFSQEPFYKKIKFYSELESRDLWEFELDFTADQIDRLLSHLWELGPTRFKYYFVDENCSYQLLSLLEIADPELRLREKFNFMTVPLDTVRELDGVIRSTQVRRALSATLSARLKRLTNEDRRIFQRIQELPSSFTGEESSALLDTLLDWQKYQATNRTDGGRAFNVELEERILLARAVRPAMPRTELTMGRSEIELERPTLGHSSSKVSVSSVRENGDVSLGFEFRPVLHDRLDADLGYVPNSSLILARTKFRYFPDDHKLALDAFTFAEVANLRSISSLQVRPSWIVSAEIARPEDIRCFDCLAGRLTFGIGLSHSILSDSGMISVLAKLRPEVSNAFVARFDQSFRWTPSLEMVTLFEFGQGSGFESKLELSGEQFWFISKLDREIVAFSKGHLTWAKPIRNWSSEVRLAAKIATDRRENFETYELSFARYF